MRVEVGWIDAATAAAQLGVHRDTLYRNAKRWGGEKVGTGPKSHWRFPVKLEPAEPAGPESLGAEGKRRKPRKATTPSVPLLAVRGESPYAGPSTKRPPEALRAPAEGLTKGECPPMASTDPSRGQA